MSKVIEAQDVNDARIKILLRESKGVLKGRARHFGLDTEGTKYELAERIANELDEKFVKDWREIVGSCLYCNPPK